MFLNGCLHLRIHVVYLRVCQGPPTLKWTPFLYVPFFHQCPLFWQRMICLDERVDIYVAWGRRTLGFRHIGSSFKISNFSYLQKDQHYYVNFLTLSRRHGNVQSEDWSVEDKTFVLTELLIG